MYQAKMAGAARCAFSTRACKRPDEHVAFEADLRSALAQQEFSLHYQPQLNARGQILAWRHCYAGRSHGAAWCHPPSSYPRQKRPVHPATGALGAAHRLHASGGVAKQPDLAPLTMAVNVSPRQFRDAGFVADVLRVLAVTGVPAAQLAGADGKPAGRRHG